MGTSLDSSRPPGKESSFMDLPPEIRFVIYSHVLEPCSRQKLDRNFFYTREHPLLCHRSLCRTINSEILDYVYRNYDRPLEVRISGKNVLLGPESGLQDATFTSAQHLWDEMQAPAKLLVTCTARKPAKNSKMRSLAHGDSLSQHSKPPPAQIVSLGDLLRRFRCIHVVVEVRRGAIANEEKNMVQAHDRGLYQSRETLKSLLSILDPCSKDISLGVETKGSEDRPVYIDGTLAGVEFLLPTFLQLGRMKRFRLTEVSTHIYIQDGKYMYDSIQYLWKRGHVVAEHIGALTNSERLKNFARSVASFEKAATQLDRSLEPAVLSGLDSQCLRNIQWFCSTYLQSFPRKHTCCADTLRLAKEIKALALIYAEVNASEEIADLHRGILHHFGSAINEDRHDCCAMFDFQESPPPSYHFHFDKVDRDKGHRIDDRGRVLVQSGLGNVYAIPRTPDVFERFRSVK